MGLQAVLQPVLHDECIVSMVPARYCQAQHDVWKHRVHTGHPVCAAGRSDSRHPGARAGASRAESSAAPSARTQAVQQQRPAGRSGAPAAGRRGTRPQPSLAAQQSAGGTAAQQVGRQRAQTRKRAAPAPAEGHMARKARSRLAPAAAGAQPQAEEPDWPLLCQVCPAMGPPQPSSAQAAASHLTAGAAAAGPLAWGSSAGGAAPPGGQPPAAAPGANLQPESEAVRPLGAEAGAAAAAGEQPLAAATDGELQLGSTEEINKGNQTAIAAVVAGAPLPMHLSDAELAADFDAVEALTPAAVQGMQPAGAQVAPPGAPQTDTAMLLDTAVVGPEVELAYPLQPQAAMSAERHWTDLLGDSGFMGALEVGIMATKPDSATVTDPMEVDPLASAFDDAIMLGEARRVVLQVLLSGQWSAPLVEVPCCTPILVPPHCWPRSLAVPCACAGHHRRRSCTTCRDCRH